MGETDISFKADQQRYAGKLMPALSRRPTRRVCLPCNQFRWIQFDINCRLRSNYIKAHIRCGKRAAWSIRTERTHMVLLALGSRRHHTITTGGAHCCAVVGRYAVCTKCLHPSRFARSKTV